VVSVTIFGTKIQPTIPRHDHEDDDGDDDGDDDHDDEDNDDEVAGGSGVLQLCLEFVLRGQRIGNNFLCSRVSNKLKASPMQI